MLRPWQSDEVARLYDIRKRSDVARWLGDPTPWPDKKYTLQRIVSWAKTPAADPIRIWAVVPLETGIPVGSVSLGHLPDNAGVEVGWYLHPDSEGLGYATEAAAAVLDLGQRAGISRIWAVMWPNNKASARVAGAIGMADLGVSDDPWYGSDEEPTSHFFRLDTAV